MFNLKGHTKKLNQFVKLHKRHYLFLYQSTYSTFPSFMNSHFTFAPSLAEEIFFERALNSISKCRRGTFRETSLGGDERGETPAFRRLRMLFSEFNLHG